jgi:tripartite-type tricarboxylate transporter receptor subunit TctC
MPISRRSLLLSAGALPFTAPFNAAMAQGGFPSKSIKLVVPFTTGGANDIIGRLVANKIGPVLGQSVVVDNRAGAGGAIGAREVARAEPDGHTVLLHSSSMVIQPLLMKSAGYDVKSDFVPVAMVSSFPLVLAVHSSVPVKTFAEFLAYARAKGDALFYGSAGIGATQHLVGELFNSMAGTNMKHVPFRGNGPATAALLAGDIKVFFDIIPTIQSLGESGKIRPLAVTSLGRNPLLPQLPTLHEGGLPNFESITWQALWLPKGTPAAVAERWTSATKRILGEKDVQTKLNEMGFQVAFATPEQLASAAERDAAKWGRVISDAQIKLDS